MRFQREAELLASLNHPNIAHIHGLEESGGVTALVMELVDGIDLSNRLARGAVPMPEALAIAKQVASARVSPDGSRVAFVQYRSAGLLTGRLAIVDRSGTVTPLTPEYINFHGIAWKGNEIVYTAADEQPLFRALWTVTPGSAPRLITRTPGNITVWDALPRGRLVTAQTDDRTFMAVRLEGEENDRDLGGGASREVPGLTGSEVPVGWISDGLLVMRFSDPSSPLGEVYKVDVKAGRQVRWKNILPRDRAGIMAFQSFRVTPDGRTHAYAWHRARSSLYIADGLT